MKLKNNDMVDLIEDKKQIMSVNYANRATRREMFKIYKDWVKLQIRQGNQDWSIEEWDMLK